MYLRRLYTVFIIVASFLMLGGIFLSSCTKIDTLPQLELSVVDMDGQAVQGVIVGLFDQLDEWSMHENPVQTWRETNDKGRVLFIDLQEQIYFFYADGDTLSNIGHEIELKEPLQLNELRKVKLIIE